MAGREELSGWRGEREGLVELRTLYVERVIMGVIQFLRERKVSFLWFWCSTGSSRFEK